MPEKKKPGRPPKPIPEQIDDDPRRVAWSVLNTKPKKREEWDYLKDEERPDVDGSSGLCSPSCTV
ncbi:MAG: hypothetical protein F4088_06495 [Chloroflexi bacterium]|nr:hypothetical protein [Chloroflexota bacterium]MXY86157.1 hypothetical protein [Chloroflexota bacterium]MYD73197.1 hypothetical protein [Chloroflexota bacterium]MYJ58494.1 hypothetical protein [Chloroflexota bacterium]